jgi:hypothetical protein
MPVGLDVLVNASQSASFMDSEKGSLVANAGRRSVVAATTAIEVNLPAAEVADLAAA